MPKLTALVAVAILSVLNLSCDKLEWVREIPNPLEPEPEVDPCDPTSSIYYNGKHFFAGEYLTDDGQVDYEKWFAERGIENSDCDPLKKRRKQPPE
jgi:hypothetical protein